MKTTITVGRSIQIFQIGLPEYWNKITIEKEFDADINEQHEIDMLMGEVEKAHERYMPIMGEPEFTQATTKKETFASLKKELNVTNK